MAGLSGRRRGSAAPPKRPPTTRRPWSSPPSRSVTERVLSAPPICTARCPGRFPPRSLGGTAVLACWPWWWSSWRWWGRSSSWRRVCRRAAADDSGFPLALSVAVTSWVLLRAVPRRGAAGL